VTEHRFHRLNGEIRKIAFFSLSTAKINGAETVTKTVGNGQETVKIAVFLCG